VPTQGGINNRKADLEYISGEKNLNEGKKVKKKSYLLGSSSFI